MVRVKTLLRYPGGKVRAVKHLMEYMPKGLKEVHSPFFGGGALEIALANKGVKVKGFDVFTPVVDFWQSVIDKPNELAAIVEGYYPITRERFYELQKEQDSLPTKLDRAAAFYVLNRSSFSGSTLSGGMSPNHPRFTESSIQRLRDFKARNLSVEVADFKDSIEAGEGAFMYCDPPYYIKSKLYGKKGNTHKDFDHEGLAKALKSRSGWVLSYNNCDYIKEVYAGYEFAYPSWKYGMSSDKESKEILIINY